MCWWINRTLSMQGLYGDIKLRDVVQVGGLAESTDRYCIEERLQKWQTESVKMD